MKSNSTEESDSSSVEFEDHIDISLLPDKKHHRRKRIRDSKFVCGIWQMFGGKNAAYGVATAVLLVSVFLIVAFARPSSSYETANKNSRKNSRYEQAKNPSSLGHGKEQKGSHSLRLPRHLAPIEYLLYLHPDLTNFDFSGKVDILLLCHETSTNITLHVGTKMDYFDVAVARVEGENILETLTVTETSRLPGEMVVISLATELQKGSHYFLVMKFKSKLSRGLAGFYLSKYRASGETRYLATTHFEPTDARNAFPCFDEPNMKAKFTIVITREKRHVALANMPLNYTEGCNSDVELCTDHFQKSVEMSTYLVAFVVCDFKSITNTTSRGVQVSVWAPPEQIDQGQFALDVAVEVLEYYEQKFKVDYPLPKQDLIAIPDFSAGAMENWGLITYRLTSLLYDEGKSSDSNKQWVAVVVAHELAHQWFGNLVTMEWWNDLWLNEGFASFMENVGVRHVHPEWKMMDQFFLDKFQVAMGLDQLSNSHPIMAEVRDPAEISSLFDSISYDKGAAIIRMLEDVLGSKLFFKGLQNYLNKYKFSNAETNDLWQCLTDEVKESGVNLDVRKMMTTWTSQMGFPVINVTVRRDANGKAMLHYQQERFLVHPDTRSPSDSAYRWVIPLTYVTQQNPSERHVQLLERQADDVLLRGVSPDATGNSWIKMNAGQSGYYRVNYDEGNWNNLKKQLNSDHTKLLGADRAGLLNDALNLARAGNLDYDLALGLTDYLSQEQEYVPWISALNGLAYFATQFSTYDMERNTQHYRIYKLYILHQIHRIASELGWEETDQDPHLKRYLRATILHLASDYEDVFPEDRPKLLENTREALRQFDGWLNGGKPIRPNLRNVVYSVGVKYADEQTWTEVFHRFQAEKVATEKRKLMYALTSSRNPGILKRLLRYSLDPGKIRSQDSVAVINSIAHNPEGRIMAWEFVQQNYDLLFKRYGTGSFEFSRLIKATTAHFNTEKKLEDVKSFFANKDTGSGKLAVLQSLESIKANIKWLKAYRHTVVAWLQDFVSSHVHLPINNPHHPVHVTSLDERYKYGRP